MKKASVVSWLLVWTLLFSWLCSITVFSDNERRYYIDASALSTSPNQNDVYYGSVLTDLGSHRWSLQTAVSSDGGCYASFSLRDAALIQQMPYLVMEVDADTTVYAYALAGQTPQGVITCPTAPSLGAIEGLTGACFLRTPQTVVFDLGSAVGENGTYTCQLFLSDVGGGRDFIVNGLYLTDRNPNAPAPATQTLSVSSLTPSLIGPDTVVTAYGDYGMTFDSSTEENYLFYTIPRATVEQYPYLFYQLEKVPSVPFVWYSICGPAWNENYQNSTLTASKTLQVLDLRTTAAYQAGGNVLLQLYHPQAITFKALVLASTDAPSFLHTPIAYSSVLDVYTLSLIDPNTTLQKDGKVGVTVHATAASQCYAYLAIPKETIDAMPYLFIRLAACTSTPTWYSLSGPSYFANYQNISYDTDLHTIDLRTTAAYQAGGPVILTFALPVGDTAGFRFDCLVLAADTAFDYTDPDKAGDDLRSTYVVDLYDDTGKPIHTQMVRHGSCVNPPDLQTEGYPNFQWYTDAAHTVAYSLSTPVTGHLKLYADWGITHTSPVFAQLQTGTTQQSQSSSIRFVAAVSSLEFRRVGFVLSVSNHTPGVGAEACTDISTRKVYASIHANGTVVPASQLHGKYLYAITLSNIPNLFFDTAVYVRAYTLDYDGNYTYSDVKQYCVTDMMATVPESLKVLTVGNSFSLNATRHLAPMLNDLGVENAVIGVLYHGSASLQVHGQYAANPDAIGYHYYTTHNTAVFEETQNVSLRYGLSQQDWDIVVFQHGGGDQGVASTYDAAILDALIAQVRQYCPNAALYWHMDWAFADGLLPENDLNNNFHIKYNSSCETMYRAITDAVEKVILPDTRFTGIIASGTLIQRLHFVYTIEELQYDYKHLSHMGEYAAAACWAASLLGKTVNGIQYYPYTYIGEYGVLEHIRQMMPLVADDPFGKTVPVFDASPS